MKVSESIKNQSQLPVMVEKSDIDSPMEYEKQTSNDSGVGHDTKTNDQFSDLDSGYPAPAAHTSTLDSIYEPLTCNGAIVIKSKVEDNQKELSASSIACECENSEVQNGLQGPPQEDNSPLEAILCKTEAPCLKSICDSATETDLVETVTSRKDTAESTSVNISSSVKVSEETDAEALVNHVSVLEASSTNGDVEVLTNSAATSDLKISTMKSSILIDKDECDGDALCTNRSPQVSAKDVPEEVELNHDPTPMSTLLDSGRNADIQEQNDLLVTFPAPETAPVVDGEAAFLSSSESLVEAAAPTESIA